MCVCALFVLVFKGIVVLFSFGIYIVCIAFRKWGSRGMASRLSVGHEGMISNNTPSVARVGCGWHTCTFAAVSLAGGGGNRTLLGKRGGKGGRELDVQPR